MLSTGITRTLWGGGSAHAASPGRRRVALGGFTWDSNREGSGRRPEHRTSIGTVPCGLSPTEDVDRMPRRTMVGSSDASSVANASAHSAGARARHRRRNEGRSKRPPVTPRDYSSIVTPDGSPLCPFATVLCETPLQAATPPPLPCLKSTLSY